MENMFFTFCFLQQPGTKNEYCPMGRKIPHISGIVIFPGNSLLSTCKHSLICYRTPPIGWCLPRADTKSCSQPHKNPTLLTSCKQKSLLSRHVFRSQGHLITGGSTVLWMLFLGYCWTKMTKKHSLWQSTPCWYLTLIWYFFSCCLQHMHWQQKTC